MDTYEWTHGEHRFVRRPVRRPSTYSETAVIDGPRKVLTLAVNVGHQLREHELLESTEFSLLCAVQGGQPAMRRLSHLQGLL